MDQDTITSKALGRRIGDRLEDVHYGKIAKVDFDYNPEVLIETIDEKLDDTDIDIVGIAFVNQSIQELDELTKSFDSVKLSSSIEDANGWRDDIHNEVRTTADAVPERLVLIYDGSPSRLTSIVNVTDGISRGDVRIEITELLKELEQFDNDVAQSLFSTLGGTFGNELELEDVAAYAASISSSESMEAIQNLYDNLYLLGLFPDNELQSNSVFKRLEINRRTVDRIADEFDDDDLVNITQAVRADDDTDWGRIEEALLKYQDTGDAEHLEDIQLGDVLELLDFEPDEEDLEEDEDDEKTDEDDQEDGPDEGAKTDQKEDDDEEEEIPTVGADNALTRLVFQESDHETIISIVNDLKESGQFESTGACSISTEIGDEEYEVRFELEQEKWDLINSVIGDNEYGALIDTGETIDDHGQLKDTEIETVFKFEEPSRLYRLYHRAEQRGEQKSLTEAIDKFREYRQELVDALPEIQFYPLFLLVGDSELLDTVDSYIHWYEELIDEVQKAAQNETDELIIELVTLDVLVSLVRTSQVENGVEAVLSPIHPFQLWKYRQLAHAIVDGIGDFDFHEQTFLEETINDPIDPLQALQFSSHEEYGIEEATLPHVGSIGRLPKYGNTIPSDIGTNDQLWNLLLDKFLTAEPHASDNLRAVVSDPLQPGNVVTKFINRAGFQEDNAEVTGFDLELGHLETTRGDILSGKDDEETEQIIDFLKSEQAVPDYQVSTFESRDRESLIETINDRPHHLTLINTRAREDYRQFEQDAYKRVNGIYLQREYDLTLTDDLKFNYHDEGELFNVYSWMSKEMDTSPTDHDESKRLTDSQFENLLDRSIWVCESLPPTNEYSGRDVTELIHEGRRGDRNFAIYSGDDEYFIRVLTDMVSSYGFPGDEVPVLVENILNWARDHGYTELLALISRGTHGTPVPPNPKGHFGTLLALRWLDERDINRPKLMFSIDDQKTRSWLELTSDDDHRADYFVVYPDQDLETLYFDVVEIKTHDHVTDSVLDWDNALKVNGSSDNQNSPPPESAELRGSSLKQAIKTSKVINQIFSDTDSPIVPPRREALRQQLFYELDEFLQDYDGDKLDTIELFNRAFKPEEDIVEIRPRTVVVDLEERDDKNTRFKGWYSSEGENEPGWEDPVQADILTAHDVHELMQNDSGE